VSFKALEVVKPYLLRVPGVAGFGLSSYYRGEFAVQGSEPVIVVYVEREDPWVLRHIPSEVEGVKVKVVVSGRFRVLRFTALQYEHRARYRPALGGTSCGSLEVGAGTLGCRVFDRATGAVLGLSNNHVIAQNWGERRTAYVGKPVVQPGVLDGGRDPDDRIGVLERWVDVNLGVENLVDVAVFRPVDGLSDAVLGLVDKPLPVVDASVGDVLRKSGRTSGVTEARVEAVGATVSVEGWGSAIFTDQIVTSTAMAQAGDSGSYTVNVSKGGTAGIVFAGSDLKTAVCRASNVERLLNVSFTEVAPTPPTWFVWMIGGLTLYLAFREHGFI